MTGINLNQVTRYDIYAFGDKFVFMFILPYSNMLLLHYVLGLSRSSLEMKAAHGHCVLVSCWHIRPDMYFLVQFYIYLVSGVAFHHFREFASLLTIKKHIHTWTGALFMVNAGGPERIFNYSFIYLFIIFIIIFFVTNKIIYK